VLGILRDKEVMKQKESKRVCDEGARDF